MSVYNTEKFVSDAISSILEQTFSDFEFIIIDDGSTDNSLKTIQEYATKDKRIRVVINGENIGLAKSLNKGIDLALGKYIARIDADDIAVPDRFEKQVAFLEKHPNFFALGGSLIFMDEYGQLGQCSAYPLRPVEVKWQTFFGNALSHPSVMLRREIFKEHSIRYNENLSTTQDYDLWAQIVRKFQIANLPDVLLYYRQHSNTVSNQSHELQKKNNLEIRKHLIEETIKMKIPSEVVEATKKPFPVSKASTALRSIVLILMLKKKMNLSELDKIDQDSIRQDVRYRIGKIIQNSGSKYLLYSLRAYYKFRKLTD